MNHRSLAFRLAVTYALLLSATFALVGAGMYYGLDHYLRSRLADSLSRRSEQVEQILQAAPPGTTDAQIAQSVVTRVAPEFNNRFVRITRSPNIAVYQSGRPADGSFDPATISPLQGPWPTRSSARQVVSRDGPVMLSATPVSTAAGRYLVELGSSLGQAQAVQDRLLSLLGLLLPVLVICAAGGGYVLVQRALRPVERMSQTAAQISVQNLDERLPIVATGDALQELSLSLNHMLGRLRDSVQTSRRFLADASHELRTPLTVIKGELQEIVRDAHCPLELRERIGSTLEEVARLERLVSGLLVLSRLDAGDAQREWLDVNLGELAGNTVEQMRLVAEDRGVHLVASRLQSLTVRGDRSRLKQVIVNLVDNAVKFTPRGGTVTLRTEQHEAGGLLEVSDTGIGIPAAAQPHVFDRFYRVDEARSRDDASEVGGVGLGLSIVHSICAAHGAQVSVESTPGRGSCFRVHFAEITQRPAPAPPTTAGGPGPGGLASEAAVRSRAVRLTSRTAGEH
ncbi:MAG TPA: ATP-binding protein [Steroidobacteraceae bacterium]|jgi:heavy metal sensor kinase|nr:ATP-binding protein [Steroidobacteraceae bacterium]